MDSTFNEAFYDLDLGESIQEAVSETESATEQTLSIPFVYGSISQALEVPLPNGHTHRWTIYLRPLQGQNLSLFISKVDFKLHEDFEMPVRICMAPPYEVTETGWGEFIVPIRVHFRDRLYCPRPLVLMHFLKLYETIGLPIDLNNPVIPPRPSIISLDPIISEFYDEFVFSNPPIEVHQQVESAQENRLDSEDGPHLDWKQQKEKQIQSIIAGAEVVKEQITMLNERIAEQKKQFDALCKMKGDVDKKCL